MQDIKNMTWEDHQEYEIDWHLHSPNRIHEPIKQEMYAEKMGLKRDYPDMDLKGQSIIDIGAGPTSMLLKYKNFNDSCVVDPLMDKFPKWVRDRYKYHNLKIVNSTGESLNLKGFDICLLYNVLQHVILPKKIIENCLNSANIIYIFEWINTKPTIGHPHELKENKLNDWLGGFGKVSKIKSGSALVDCYYGVFKGKTFKKNRI